MVNILYLITELDIGGAEKMLYNLATGLNRRIYNVSCACLTGHGEIGKKLSESGISVEYLKMRGKSDFMVLWRILRLLKEKNIHILHTYLFHANFIGRIAGRIAKVPIIISSIRVSEMRRSYDLLLDRFSSTLIDAETCVCEAVREFTAKYAKIRPEKLVVIPNGIDPGELEKNPNREGKKSEFGINPSTKVVGTVSRLTKQKGLKFFLNAASQIIKKNPDASFMILGHGEMENELKRIAQELGIQKSVIFTGFREDALEIMGIFDVFVLSSIWEGMPVALLEAMALSKPVVATSVGGCRELISDGENGFLVKPFDTRKLSEAILRILEDQELASAMGRKSRSIAENYTVQKMVKSTEQLYEKLLKSKNLSSLHDSHSKLIATHYEK